MDSHHSYRIGEVARLTGVSVEALRFYERRRLLDQPARTDGGMRRYGDDVLQRVRFIKQAQTLGLTLDNIGQLVNGHSLRSRTGCRRVHDLLTRRIADIDARVAELRALKKTLEQHRRACATALDARPEPTCPTLEVLEGGRS